MEISRNSDKNGFAKSEANGIITSSLTIAQSVDFVALDKVDGARKKREPRFAFFYQLFNPSSNQRGNPQNLARINLVRALEHRLVGFEDHVVLRTVAVVLVRDLPRLSPETTVLNCETGVGFSTVS